MNKLIVLLFVIIFIVGCGNTTEDKKEKIVKNDTIVNEVTNEIEIIEDEVTSYAVINTLENEDNLYVRLVFISKEPFEYVNFDESFLEISYDSKFTDGDLVDIYTKDYKDKIVFFRDFIIKYQDINELANKIKNISFEIGVGVNTIEHNIETIYINEEPLKYIEDNNDFSFEILKYEIKDNRRYYSLPYKLEFIKFSITNDIDESVYVAVTPSIKEESEKAYLCIYVPYTDIKSDSNPINDQAVECYAIDKGINASSTCCASGMYDSFPTKDYDNGYRVSQGIASLDMVLTNEKDISIYNDVSNKYPIIKFE